MSGLDAWVRTILTDAQYSVGLIDGYEDSCLAFENGSVLGFALTYRDPASLISTWRETSSRVAQFAQFALRRADAKAWNAYFLFLTEARGDYGQDIAIGAIEEDLVGTRKIARAGITSLEECRSTLLPLIPVQNAPRLEAVDMTTEIRLRTSELPSQIVEAFLTGASETTLAQLLETAQ